MWVYINMNLSLFKQTSNEMEVANNHNSFGFTIVELLVVIVVIGILVAITIVSYTGLSSKATVASLQSDLSSASKKLKIDQVINNNYPTNLADAVNRKIISYDSNTTPAYVVNNNITPQVFCLSYTKNSQTYKVTETGTSTTGDCTNYLPVLYLDAGNTASYPGTGTTWTDLSGLGNNGTLVNGVGYTSANGGALTFDGVDDYVNAPATVSSMPYSVEIWFSQSELRNLCLVTTSTLGNSHVSGILSNKLITYADGSYYTYSSRIFSSSDINKFIYAVFVFEEVAGDRQLKNYVNGSLDGSNIAGGVLPFPGGQTRIGNQVSGSGFGILKGSISSVRVYNRALSSLEITQNFNTLKGRYGL